MNASIPPARPEAELPLITDDRPARRIGYLILLLTLGSFTLWSYLAPIDSAALAPGYVAVKSHRRTVQHLEGGIVSQLMVRDGDEVKQGDVLLVLDDTQLKAQLEIYRGQYISALALEARLIAERDELPKVVYPEELSDLADPRNVEARHGQDQIFRARKNTHDGEISVLKQRINQLQSKIEGLRAQRSSTQALARSLAEEIKDLRELLSEGFADKQRLRELERNHTNAEGRIAELTAEIATAEMQIGETRLQILQIEKQFHEDIVNKLGEVQVQLFNLREQLRAGEDRVARTVIRAPVDGMVLGVSVHTIGGVIRPGEPILDIVPHKEELVIMAQVSPIDIDRVSVGLEAEVRFSAFKQAITPKMYGKVITLSADRLVDEKTGYPYYQAQIELTPESFEKLGNLQLVPGMPAEVLINTGERTLVEYLMQPLTNAFARAFIED